MASEDSNSAILPATGHSNGASDSSFNGASHGASSSSRAKAQPVVLSTSKDPNWKYRGVKNKPTRKEVDQTLGAITNLVHASNKPLPNRFGDGKERKSVYDEQYGGTWADIKFLLKNGNLGESYRTVKALSKAKKNPGYTDDKTYIVSFCSPPILSNLLIPRRRWNM